MPAVTPQQSFPSKPQDPGLREALGLHGSPLHNTPLLPPRGHFQDGHPLLGFFQRAKDHVLILSGPRHTVVCGVRGKFSHPTMGREAILLFMECSHQEVNSVYHCAAQRGGSRTRTQGLPAKGTARAPASCSGFLLTEWFADSVYKDKFHSHPNSQCWEMICPSSHPPLPLVPRIPSKG